MEATPSPGGPARGSPWEPHRPARRQGRLGPGRAWRSQPFRGRHRLHAGPRASKGSPLNAPHREPTTDSVAEGSKTARFPRRRASAAELRTALTCHQVNRGKGTRRGQDTGSRLSPSPRRAAVRSARRPPKALRSDKKFLLLVDSWKGAKIQLTNSYNCKVLEMPVHRELDR
ncbi:uncharacterized protein LOC121825273 [Peromyscus maniculatus bairdii]|uniref:uncharacterized protein LOC121825273 n=1 Tax=Peromyscus maniculatus bairdii TaxID=230844 RepID=UPI003FCF4516